jgi:DNA-binding response OmpR family regulator
MNKTPKPGYRACILVVDDDVKILRLLRISLTIAGYEVVTAASGGEALQLQESEKPDVMLLDMFMPTMDGFEVLRRLRAASDLPVIACSAHASNCEKALQLGATDFLAKPFIPNELVQRIEALLKK